MDESKGNLEKQIIIKNHEIDNLDKDEAKKLAQKLRFILSGLEKKLRESNEKERSVSISKYVADTSKSLTEKISNYLLIYLKNFYPTSQKILSSIILGPTISLLMNEFLKQYDTIPQTSHLISLGTITTTLSYSLQSIYQKQKNQ